MHGPLNVKLGILRLHLDRFVASRTLLQYELNYELEMAADHSSVLINVYTGEINVRSLPHKVRCCTKAKSHCALLVIMQQTAYRLFFVPYNNLSSPHF